MTDKELTGLPLEIAIDRIDPNPYQPRTTFDQAKLLELAGSIRRHGVVQPLILSTNGGSRYILIAGERRWRAARLAGLATVPAYIRNHEDPRTMAILALVENADREDLNPIEEARAYRRLMVEFGLSVEDIAQARNCHPRTVENRLIWLQLEPEVQELVAQGGLPCDARAAAALLSIQDSSARVKMAIRLAHKRVKIKTILVACEKLVEQLKTRSPSCRHPALSLARRRAKRDAPADDDPVALEAVRSAAAAVCQACEIKARVLQGRVAEPAWSLIAHASSDTCGERADAFLVLASALGFSTNTIAAMMNWGTAMVSYRLAILKRRKRVRPLIRRYGLKVEFNPRTGNLFADWKHYRKRFPRLARAMDHLRRGQPMSTREVLYARGILLQQALHSGNDYLAHALAGGVVSERRLRRVYATMKGKQRS